MTNRPDTSFRYLSDGVAPDRNLTREEKLLADVIKANERIPVGLQIGMPRHLKLAITRIDTLFIAHDLPHREELLNELTLWRIHAEQGLTFARTATRS